MQNSLNPKGIIIKQAYKLIAVEGGEGSGKSSFVQSFRDDTRFFLTREPGGSPFAEKIRDLILSSDAKDTSAITMLYLFAAARCDHFEKTVCRAHERGKHVLSDRLDGSTFAYQIYGQEAQELVSLLNTLRKSWSSICNPSFYLFFDVDPETGLARRQKDMKMQNKQTTHFDDRELDFHCRLREGYLEFLKDKPHAVVDANRPQKRVFEEARAIIESIII